MGGLKDREECCEMFFLDSLAITSRSPHQLGLPAKLVQDQVFQNYDIDGQCTLGIRHSPSLKLLGEK